MSTGNIVEIIGAVVDVQFPRGDMPKVYDALKIESAGLTLEVQQQLGDGVVRTIAMGSTDGLRRGLDVVNTGGAIQVPVGQATLGRIMDVLGNPVDEAGPIATEERMPIHRAAPRLEDQAATTEVLETGIKVIDLIMPIQKGGKVGLFGGAGVGKTVTLMELIRNIEDRRFAQAGRADRLVRGWRGEGDLSWRPRSRLEMALKGIFGIDRDAAQTPATKVTRITLKPRAVYSFSGKGQFRGELDFTEVRAEPGNRVIPFELAQGNRVVRTFRWDVSFIYRVSTNLQASLSYQGRNEPHRPRTLHIAKAEVRAFF